MFVVGYRKATLKDSSPLARMALPETPSWSKGSVHRVFCAADCGYNAEKSGSRHGVAFVHHLQALVLHVVKLVLLWFADAR